MIRSSRREGRAEVRDGTGIKELLPLLVGSVWKREEEMGVPELSSELEDLSFFY